MRQSPSALVVFWIAVGLAGCAGVARQEDDQLVLAGFTKTPATTPETTAALKSLPAHRFVHQTVNGTRMVFYADPVGCKCVYSATAQTYASYKQTHRDEVAAFDSSLGGGDSGQGE